MLGPGYTKDKRDQLTVILPTEFKFCEITPSLVMYLAETSFRDVHNFCLCILRDGLGCKGEHLKTNLWGIYIYKI